MILLSAQGMAVAKIAEVAFTSADRVRDVIHNFNADGFDSLYPKYAGGRPKTFTLPNRREIKKIAKSSPTEHDLPFSTWSLSKLAEFLVAEGVVDDISHEGLRVLLREEGVSFQKVKIWKRSRDPEYAVKKARVEHLYAIAHSEVVAESGEPEVVFCLDEFGQAEPAAASRSTVGAAWWQAQGPDREPRRRRRATYTRPHGVRHLFAACDLGKASCTGTSRRRRTAPRSSSSADTCAPCIRLRCASRSCDKLLTSPDREEVPTGRSVGGGEQCRVRIHTDEQFVVEPHRGAVHRVAVLHARRHRPR